MARPPRHLPAGSCFHIYNRGVEGRPIFLGNDDYVFFLDRLQRLLPKKRVACFSYCLMTTHFHLFLSPAGNDLSDLMHGLEGYYAQSFNHRHGRYGPLFQGRFQSKEVTDGLYAATLLDYIHSNPVEGGICTDPAAYEWSSCRLYAGKEAFPEWLRMINIF